MKKILLLLIFLSCSGFSLIVENDTFGLISKSDKSFTNGMAVSWLGATVDNKQWIWSIGQNMYTPEDISIPYLIEDDRPYAGFLYASSELLILNEGRENSVIFTGGIIGPASFSEEAQIKFHNLIGAREPMGWDNQLPNEPAFNLTIKERRKYDLIDDNFDFIGHIRGDLGTVRTGMQIGGKLRLGYNLQGFYDPRIVLEQWNEPISAFLFAGANIQLVGRDVFLDGPTWREGHSVVREAFVGEGQFGLALGYKEFSTTFTQVMRTDQFVGQSGGHNFGIISINWGLTF